MTSQWGWNIRSARNEKRSRSDWVAPFVAAAPWVTLLVLLLMLHLMGGVFTISRGTLFDLPVATAGDTERTDLAMLVLPTAHDTLVFFDDARYVMSDPQSMHVFSTQLEEVAARKGEHTILVLADRRVACGELMRIADIVRTAGIGRVLFAAKTQGELEE